MNKKENESKLNTLLKIRDDINTMCPTMITPSISITPEKMRNFEGFSGSTMHDFGYNDGVRSAMDIIMGRIKDIADFVSVCCGKPADTLTKTWVGGGRVYSKCRKCKKECEQEWRIKQYEKN